MSEQPVASDKTQEQIVEETKAKFNDLAGRAAREFPDITAFVGYVNQFIDGETDVVTLPEVSGEKWLYNLRREVESMVDTTKPPVLIKMSGWELDPNGSLETVSQQTVLKNVYLEHNLDTRSNKYSLRLTRDTSR